MSVVHFIEEALVSVPEHLAQLKVLPHPLLGGERGRQTDRERDRQTERDTERKRERVWGWWLVVTQDSCITYIVIQIGGSVVREQERKQEILEK